MQRMRHGQFPHGQFNPYPDYVDYYTSIPQVEPLGNPQEPKRRFVPSKHEAKRVVQLVNAIRNGWIRDPADAPPPPPETYLLWDDTPKQDEHSHKYEPIPAPKVRLPGHNESYNPPEEYLLTPAQERIWHDQEMDER